MRFSPPPSSLSRLRRSSSLSVCLSVGMVLREWGVGGGVWEYCRGPVVRTGALPHPTPYSPLPTHNVTFRSAATRFIASVTSNSDGSRVPIDFASRMRASASMASYAAKLSSSVFVTTSIPISASPNSTSPRSSNRFTIDRARNSICRMLVGMGAAILKHHLDAERTGCIWIPDGLRARNGGDVRCVERGGENVAAINAEGADGCAMNRFQQGDRERGIGIHSSKRQRANVHPRADGTNGVAGPIPVRRRIVRHRARFDRLSASVETASGLLHRQFADERRKKGSRDVRREPDALRRVAFAADAGKRIGNRSDDCDVERGEIDERTKRQIDDRDVDAPRLLGPLAAVDLVCRDTSGGDEAFNPAGPHRQECLCHTRLRLCHIAL